MSSQVTLSSSRLNDIAGPGSVVLDPQHLAPYAVDGLVPRAAVRPGSVEEIAEIVKFAATENLAVIPTGSRTKLGIGMPPTRYDLAVDMKRLDRVISYDPGDLTLSVEAGVPLVRLGEVLAQHNQFLPLEVPFYERATVGGTLASGVDSPLRQAYGTPRDFVLGMEFITCEGALAKSGGRVVKNVTGYDLHKLMLGAIGSLGIITRINFKTFPVPASSRMLLASFASIEAALSLRHKIVASHISPSTLEILNPAMVRLLLPAHANSGDWLLATGISGSEAVLNRCGDDLRRMAQQCDAKHIELISGTERQNAWIRLREAIPLILQSSPAAVILKIGAVPTDVPCALQFLQLQSDHYGLPASAMVRGLGIIYWSILLDSSEVAEKVGNCGKVLDELDASRRKFSAVAVVCPPQLKREVNIWGAPREDFPLMQRVKGAFDPHNIFAPGRFVGGL